MQGAKVFSSLDLLSAYHQIRLVDDDVVKRAFKTPFGLFEYKVMPFGLTNASSVLMSGMNEILQGLSCVSIYLDDILIFSKTPEEHISHVETVLGKSKNMGYF
jgi:putative transposase